ncbi:MAG: hypothetical protein ABJF10_25225 [Chthoniobacter sp.]|uniref:hypothetical protein n=1 Tax=Chthoniobacter sp. TaxID=2510640 RepID=UPI0032A62AF5
MAPAFARPHHKDSAAYTAAVKASTAKAMAMFPDYDVAGTPIHQAIQDEIQRQKEINPTYFKNPEWPEQIARACAAVLGIEPARPMQASK